ncbi:ArnT family glycosyltransferase [Paraburkholderia flava]|uniref:ArnT family glycosyltransferase n=1 Tax=Paraburkholderia flava TaxID=2547393 RepID=UPI0010601FAE|nr:glycosyl transferase [Paraburkholderia flava]
MSDHRPRTEHAGAPSSKVAPASAEAPHRWHRVATLPAVRWIIALAMLCAWLLPGTLGHDPWKQDETYTFGIVQHMLDTGDLVVPTNAGQPFVEKPPLYDWVAAGFAWLLDRYLPLHDAARLASALFAALTLACTARLARAATRATHWLDARIVGTVALFAGTLVVVKHSHDLMTDVGLMAGAALGFCGLFELVVASLREPAEEAPRGAATMFGAGVGIALMTKGLFVPLVFGATLGAVLLLYPACRNRRFARSLGIAALVFAPFALIWPIAFYLQSPALFKVWLWDNNIGRFVGFSVPQLGSESESPWFVLRTALTVGFPAIPFALVALIGGGWRRIRAPQIALPLLFGGIGLTVLQVSATVRELYILPFIAPFALLGAQGIVRVPQRVHVTWDIVSRVLFGGFALLVWIVWSTMTEPADTHASLHWLGRWLPLDWVLPIRPVLIVAALELTLGWLWLLPFLKYTGKWRGVFSWCAGAIVAWGLVSTLLLPWLDVAKSYRSVFEDLSTKLAAEWNIGDCMASSGLGESEAPMLAYFTGIEHVPAANLADAVATGCTWLIVESHGPQRVQPDDQWQPFWSGARPGDTDERLRVFVRTPDDAAATP